MNQAQFDAYTSRIDALADDVVGRVKLDSFALTKEERAVLDAAPSIVAHVDDSLSRYTAVAPDQRRSMVLKALAQSLLNAASVRKALDIGYGATR